MFRDGQDAWVTGEALDEAIAFKSTYSDLDRAEASTEKWSPAVTATLLQYGLYCAKNVGPQSFPINEAGTAMLNGVELQPQRYHVSTLSAPKEAMNRDPAVNAHVNVIAEQTMNPNVPDAK